MCIEYLSAHQPYDNASTSRPAKAERLLSVTFERVVSSKQLRRGDANHCPASMSLGERVSTGRCSRLAASMIARTAAG